MNDGNDITERLVDYSLGLHYEDIPPEAVDRAKQLFLDFLGVAAGGCSLAQSVPSILGGVDALASDSSGGCTVIGRSRPYPAHYAALLNGAMAHSIDFDDIHSEAHIHAAAPLFPALLAAAEVGGASGRDFLAAVVAGYDAICKLGKAHGERLHKRKLHPTATTGIFGVTMATGALMGLDRGTLLNAVAINLSQTAGAQQFLETGGWNKHLQVGLVSHNAIYSLVFAQNGFLGSPKPLEGRFGYFPTYVVDGYDLDRATQGLGQEFEVLQTAVKPYPCCRYSHTTIDGVVEIVQRERIAPKDIEAVDVTLSETGYGIVGGDGESKRRPSTLIDAQFSVYFAAAVAALERGYTWQSHQRIGDPNVLAIVDKTRVSSSTNLGDWASRVAIATTDGKKHVAETDMARGEPEKPLGWPELEAKFNSLWSEGSFDARAQDIVDGVKRLDEIKDFREVSTLLKA